MTNPFEAIPVADRMRVRRQHLQLSREEASAKARRYLPAFLPMSREILRKLETGDHSPDDHPLQVIALARALDVAPAWFGVTGGEGFDRLGELLRTAETGEVSEAPLRPHGSPARPDRRSRTRISGWPDGTAGQTHLLYDLADGSADAEPLAA